MNLRLRLSVFLGLSLAITGCVAPSAAQRTLLETETTAVPVGRAAPAVSAGSLTPVAAPISGEYRGLLSGRRASRVGDTLTVVLDELTRASKDGGTNANRRSANDLSGGLDLVTRDLLRGVQGANNRTQSNRAGVDLRSDTVFNSSGNSTASNQFNGKITVTVVEVLANGNLRVAGEKKLAVGAEEEIIRFGGVVSPTNIARNMVLSSRVADARIEYRGKGDTDLVKRPGWLTRLLLRASPN